MVNHDVSKEAYRKNDIVRWVASLALGMLVVLWRVVLPTNAGVTQGMAILITVLDLVITVAVVFLNRKELKKAFAKRFTFKDTGKTALLMVVDFIIIVIVTALVSINSVPLPDLTTANAPAELVATEFRAIFAIGAFISMVVLAPVWEEIVFRLAGKNLLRNGFVFVIVTPCLFAFIHTANFSIADNLFYIVTGVNYAVAYLLFKDIRIMIAAHFVWNLISGVGALLS